MKRFFKAIILGVFLFTLGNTQPISIPDMDVESGTIIQVPILLNELDVFEDNIDFQLTFDSNVIQPINAEINYDQLPPSFQILSPDLNINDNPIYISISGGTGSWSGNGAIVYINFQVIGAVGDMTNIDFSFLT